MPEKIQVLDINLQEALNPLQGRTHRGNLQRTGILYSEPVLKKPTIKWKYGTGGAIKAQPIVYRDVAYVFSYDKRIYAIDATTGDKRWSYLTSGGPPIGKNFTPSAPTIKDDVLYIGDNAGTLYAIETKTGRPKWKTTARGTTSVTGSPVPIYGAIFVNVNGWNKAATGVMAVHGKNGLALTIYKNTTWGANQSYAVAEGSLVCGGQIAATRLDLRTGERTGIGASNWGGNYNIPVVSDGRVYVLGTGVCVGDFRSGRPLHNVPIEGNDYRSTETQKGISENTLAIWKKKLYFGNQLGYAYCYDAMTIKRIWRTKLSKRARSAPIICASTPKADDAIMYIGDEAGGLHALNANTGKHLWEINLGSGITADPWIVDGILYVATEKGELFALENK